MIGKPSSAPVIGMLAAAGSAFLLAAAFAFQFAGYAPCELCILQRWPHVAAVVVGLLIWQWRGARRWLLWLGFPAALVATGLAAHHTGVEWGWWPGPVACSSGGNIGALSASDLLAQIESNTRVIRCDEPALVIFGLSMAGWNALASLVLAGLWLFAARRAR